MTPPPQVWGGTKGEVANMKVPSTLIKTAKQLRTAQTPWEAKLWRHLRGGRLGGLKFKRQVPIGPYIADFCCHPAKLIIELDGGQHSETAVEAKDKAKAEYFRREGYRVLRFWNNEVENNLDGVLETITLNLSPNLSPRLGRGGNTNKFP